MSDYRKWDLEAHTREFWKPENVAERRRLDHEAEDRTVNRIECPDCLAQPGQRCVGLATGFHFARGASYARKGGVS